MPWWCSTSAHGARGGRRADRLGDRLETKKKKKRRSKKKQKEPESVDFRFVIQCAFMRPFPEFRLPVSSDSASKVCPGGLVAAGLAGSESRGVRGSPALGEGVQSPSNCSDPRGFGLQRGSRRAVRGLREEGSEEGAVTEGGGRALGDTRGRREAKGQSSFYLFQDTAADRLP